MTVTTFAKSIANDVARAEDASRGRVVRVTETRDNMVHVVYAEGHDAWYPSVIAGVPVDTIGVVLSTRADDGVFVPIGLPYFDEGDYWTANETATNILNALSSYATDAEVAALLSNYALISEVNAAFANYYTMAQINSLIALYNRKPVRNRKITTGGNQAISTAGSGFYPFMVGGNATAGEIGLSGLIPSTNYVVQVAVSMRITGSTSGSGRIGFQLAGGTPATQVSSSDLILLPATQTFVTWDYEAEYMSSAGGAITVRPGTVWGAASFTPTYCSVRARAEVA